MENNWQGMKYADPYNRLQESNARSLQILIFKSTFTVFWRCLQT